MVVFKGRRQWVSLLTIFSAARFGISEYTPEALENQVDWNSLPGAEALHVNGAFNMFAGYITVDEDHGRKNFYWFMEAQENPEDAPVMLWTNGGPGSSGFIGLLTEHGPFSVREGGSLLVDNDYSWNKLANMLYIETPSGVGYSYSETVEDYKTGDDQTAVDNYWLVQGWLDRFPQYRRNAFHISSESYGGHYMPQLAEEIVKRNAQVAEDGSAPVINFAGFLVGNPYTDARSNTVAQYHAYWGKQLLPKPVFEEWWVKCVMGGEGYVWSSECDALEEWMDELIGELKSENAGGLRSRWKVRIISFSFSAHIHRVGTRAGAGFVGLKERSVVTSHLVLLSFRSIRAVGYNRSRKISWRFTPLLC